MVIPPAAGAPRGAASHYGPDGKAKEAWPTRRSGRARIRLLERRYATELHLYRCGSCSLWHMATGPKRTG